MLFAIPVAELSMKMISKLHLFVFSVALSQHLSEIHLNSPLHVCEVTVLARNCLTSILDYIVMQMRKTNREKGYWCFSSALNNYISLLFNISPCLFHKLLFCHSFQDPQAKFLLFNLHRRYINGLKACYMTRATSDLLSVCNLVVRSESVINK